MVSSPSGDADPTIAPLVGPADPRRFTDSGIEVQPVYRAGGEPPPALEAPGEFP